MHLRSSAVTTQLALFGVSEILHKTNFAHGHEVAREIEFIGTVNRYIVDTDDEFRVGEFARAQTYLLGGTQHRRLRINLRGIARRDTLRIHKR